MTFNEIYEEFKNDIEDALKKRASGEVRVGAELKFPLVEEDGRAACLERVNLLWEHLSENGWDKDRDPVSGAVVGCRKEGPQNHTVASTETGYAKTEFSLAHESSLFETEKALNKLIAELLNFQRKTGLSFLCAGIHPVSPPCRDLMAKKSRTSVWDKIFKSNNHIPESHGDDMHLFTVNAASHVHVSVPYEEMVDMVNVLNGFSPAQIALTAHSNIWRGSLDAEYKCAAETFWDRWIPEGGRIGMPEEPFKDLRDYLKTILSFKPVYVIRENTPVLLPGYTTFQSYYEQKEARGVDINGNEAILKPGPSDLKLHNTLYWFNARISGYYTVENRLIDQQPQDALLAPSAITLGLAFAAGEALDELSRHKWEDLRKARITACRRGMDDDFLQAFAARMLYIAEKGLKKRGLGEEIFLSPLHKRLENRSCPADEAVKIFKNGGMKQLLEDSKLRT